MPELPEVQTTVNGINRKVKGFKIVSVWSIYNSSYYKSKQNIKDPDFFTEFKKRIIGTTIKSAERRAKNILINLSNDETILIHMKMTGHLMFGEYAAVGKKKDDPWVPVDKDNKSLNDPFNSHIRLVFSLESPSTSKTKTLKNNKHLVLSDTRKFAKVTVIKTDKIFHSPDLAHLGPEPLEEKFTFDDFKSCLLKKPNGKIKSVLLDQTIIAGIGNIYSDESLWLSNIHPESLVKKISTINLKKLFTSIQTVLRNGIDFGGDSMSDYRNIDGEKGSFQEKHNAYRKTNQKCSKKGCDGNIKRIVVGGRGTHYCDHHQIKYN
ncbi:MAG: bifunctional DNA-formamidopyrimidine glycosylase/DNA-(apurinic or apyrimidinic site) lyase [bacterium]